MRKIRGMIKGVLYHRRNRQQVAVSLALVGALCDPYGDEMSVKLGLPLVRW